MEWGNIQLWNEKRFLFIFGGHLGNLLPRVVHVSGFGREFIVCYVLVYRVFTVHKVPDLGFLRKELGTQNVTNTQLFKCCRALIFVIILSLKWRRYILCVFNSRVLFPKGTHGCGKDFMNPLYIILYVSVDMFVEVFIFFARWHPLPKRWIVRRDTCVEVNYWSVYMEHTHIQLYILKI